MCKDRGREGILDFGFQIDSRSVDGGL